MEGRLGRLVEVSQRKGAAGPRCEPAAPWEDRRKPTDYNAKAVLGIKDKRKSRILHNIYYAYL